MFITVHSRMRDQNGLLKVKTNVPSAFAGMGKPNVIRNLLSARHVQIRYTQKESAVPYVVRAITPRVCFWFRFAFKSECP